MRNVIIGYQYNKQQLFIFLKECEANGTQLQDHAFTYYFDCYKDRWIAIDDRAFDKYDLYCEKVEEEYTTDEFVKEILYDHIGEFWIVRKES